MLVAAQQGSGSAAEPATNPASADQAALVAGKALKNYLDALSGECHELPGVPLVEALVQGGAAGKAAPASRPPERPRGSDRHAVLLGVDLPVLGLEPQDVYRLYGQKLGINHARQDQDRTQAQHAAHEEENRKVL